MKRAIGYLYLKRRWIILLLLIVLGVFYFLKNFYLPLKFFASVSFFVLFYLIDYLFGINFQKRHYVYIIFISVFGIFLSQLYFISPNYDKALHLIQPIMASSIFFFMVAKLKLEFKWKLMFTFFIVLAFVGLFEI